MTVVVYSDADKEKFRSWSEALTWKDRQAVSFAALQKDSRGRYRYGLYDILPPDEVARCRAEFDAWVG